MTAKKTVLVTGGAGYIGSHTAWRLVDAGYAVVVLDNFYSGHRWAVHPSANLVEGNAGDISLVRRTIRDFRVDSVIHFAGHIVVPESVQNPLKYYENNTCVSRNLINACLQEGIAQFVFSSSAAVYGVTSSVPVSESAATNPISPYGRSKLMTEWMLRDISDSTSGEPSVFRYVALRYFNVAGAREDGALGQATKESTHLIKVACEAACGLREFIPVYGTDYETPDGTCIRDYIHVEDLAQAHVAALRYLENGGSSEVLNCGYGHGFSVRQVLSAMRKVSGNETPVREVERRSGDVPILVSDPSRIKSLLHWKPDRADLEMICSSALGWERKIQASMPGVNTQ